MTVDTNNPFGKDFTYKGVKLGGVNRPGMHGGEYEDADGKRSLFKQDTKNNKIRMAKVIGEAVGGQILASWFKKLNVDKNRYAEVRLVKAGNGTELTGVNVYLQSIFINNYKEDFWKHAYREEFKNVLESDDDATLIPIAIEYLENQIKKLLDKYKTSDEKTRLEIKAQIDAINEKIKLYQQGSIVNRTELINDAAEGKVNKKKRPSAAEIVPGSKVKVRQVISNAIMKTPKNMQQFAEITAPRLLIGDFGVHNGNFGITKDGNLVCLDYGAAFSKLNSEFDPFSKSKETIGTWKRYKNHLLEYDDRIIKGPEMAITFIKIGRMSKEEVENLVKDALKMLDDKYDSDGLKKFAERLGIKDKALRKITDSATLKKLIENFMNERLIARSQSMKKIGIAHLLENCYDNDKKRFNLFRFADLIEKNQLTAEEVQEIYQFAESPEFKRSSSFKENIPKQKIISAFAKYNMEVREYQLLALEIKHMINYLAVEKIPSNSPVHQQLKTWIDRLNQLVDENPLLRFEKAKDQYKELTHLIKEHDKRPTPQAMPKLTRASTQSSPLKPTPLARKATSPAISRTAVKPIQRKPKQAPELGDTTPSTQQKPMPQPRRETSPAVVRKNTPQIPTPPPRKETAPSKLDPTPSKRDVEFISNCFRLAKKLAFSTNPNIDVEIKNKARNFLGAIMSLVKGSPSGENQAKAFVHEINTPGVRAAIDDEGKLLLTKVAPDEVQLNIAPIPNDEGFNPQK